MAIRRKASRRWHSANTHPIRKGWYEVRAADGRWGGETSYRAWGNRQWWTQLSDGGWFGAVEWKGQYQWRGPAIDIRLDYSQVMKRMGRKGAVA